MNTTLMWGIVSFLLLCIIALIGIVYGTVTKRLDNLDCDIKKRTLIVACDRIHEDVDKYLHHHSRSGDCGEAVPK